MKSSKKWWLNNPDTLREGIGAVLHWKPTGWMVHRTLRGSPAFEAGIKKGDFIHSINGHELASKQEIKELFAIVFKFATQSSNLFWTHKIKRNGDEQTHQIRPVTLRKLIDQENEETENYETKDYENEDSQAEDSKEEESSTEYCFSCYECYQETDGWYECGDGGCSGKCYLA